MTIIDFSKPPKPDTYYQMFTKPTLPDFFSRQVSGARRFYLNLQPPRSVRPVVVSGGCEHCEPGYEIKRRGFRYLSIEYVAAGRGSLTLKGRPYLLTAGTVFAYGPRIAQEIQTDPDNPLLKYFVDFVGDDARELLTVAHLDPGSVMQTSTPAQVSAIFENLIRNGQNDSPLSARLCAVILEELLLKLAETAVSPRSAGTPAFQTYRRCRLYIEEHFMELGSLKDIASRCHIDRAYLCRLFRRFDHQRPYQLLTRLRMTRAAELLQQPGAMVKQVAAEMDCCDPYHFSRVFKRVHGIPPREFVRLRDD
ncbi:MAG: AraC family transcriptional regulator [Kiritimatiellia bacterium]|jgi:AraC-like DNA-binding protein|nr:AraC family transcriptional regulator [Kiritimatiellia bacterium]MDP6810863.1 AraC family transcriptional regulator [Kiritimatiellia bacterium]MDP7024206.1 AraC family transcriptional regulator [Kiritimatiellia bacterium]